jgi:hypothetical protein
MIFRLLPFILAIFLFDCTGQPGPSGPSEAVVRVHAEILILREEVRLRGLDSAALQNGTDSLLRLSGVSRDAYASALADLRSDLGSWKAFNERVARRLDSLQRQSQPPDSAAKPAGIRRESRPE